MPISPAAGNVAGLIRRGEHQNNGSIEFRLLPNAFNQAEPIDFRHAHVHQ